MGRARRPDPLQPARPAPATLARARPIGQRPGQDGAPPPDSWACVPRAGAITLAPIKGSTRGRARPNSPLLVPRLYTIQSCSATESSATACFPPPIRRLGVLPKQAAVTRSFASTSHIQGIFLRPQSFTGTPSPVRRPSRLPPTFAVDSGRLPPSSTR
jgi:hypothetical protein